MTVVTRFPPSPTGFMHIGNARTALLNYLFARRHGGKFLFRIEDTDRKRHSEEAVEAIIKGLEWLGLDYDGEIVSQFANQERHAEVAKQLVAEGKAYYCYCSPEELEEMRETARAEGRPVFYDRRWRDRDPSEAPKDVKPVIRIKAPLEGETTIDDKVQGKVTVKNKQIDDFVLMRSDGTPTYMLSVVVDDHDMGVTHIIRGDDHLNNAFRQKIIFDAMGWDVPVYAHTPLIHGPDGKKFSKRHGATAVHEYRDMGYLPEALRNYLLRLGWSHGDDEIIPNEKAIEWFNLEGLGKSPASFDFAKLESLNAHYINQMDINELITLAEPFYGIPVGDQARKWIAAHGDELKSRAKTLLQFAEDSKFYAKVAPFAFDEKAIELIADKEILQALEDKLSALDKFSAETIQHACKEVADTHREGKLGKVAMPLRAALTGTTVSPSIFEAAAIMGREEIQKRLEAALAH